MSEITCRELIEQLDAYVDGTMPAEQRAVIDAHLAQCRACVAYLNNYRNTIALGRFALKESDESLPPDLPQELLSALLASRKRG